MPEGGADDELFLQPHCAAGAVRGLLGALVQRVDLLSAFAKGVREGLQVVLDMFPSLMLLTLAVSVFQSSGALELLSRALSAPASLLGLPEPIIP